MKPSCVVEYNHQMGGVDLVGSTAPQFPHTAQIVQMVQKTSLASFDAMYHE